MEKEKKHSKGTENSVTSSDSGQQIEESKELIGEIIGLLDLGCIIKAVLMEPEGIRAVEESIKIISNMSEAVIQYQSNLKNVIRSIKSILLSDLREHKLQEIMLEYKKISNILPKQHCLETNHNRREEIIESMANHLFNAKKNIQTIQEKTPSEFEPFSNSVLQLVKQNSCEIFEPKIHELRKAVSNLENEGEIQRKLLEDSTKSILEKDEKISNLKFTISKLEDHIIRQVKEQNETSSRIIGDKLSSTDDKLTKIIKNIENSQKLIQSENLEKEVSELKKEIETLRINLYKNVETISEQNHELNILSTKIYTQQENQKGKNTEFIELNQEYQEVQSSIFNIVNHIKYKPNYINHEQSNNTEDSYHDNDININSYSNLKIDYHILLEKYNRLQILFQNSKKETIKFCSTEPPIIKKSSEISLPSPNEPQETDNFEKEVNEKKKNKARYSTPRLQKKEIFRKMDDMEFCEKEQTTQTIKSRNSEEKLSLLMKNLTLESLINAEEMNNKIQGFDYNTSIVHKISSSKFINTFSSKISFILEYVCLLELYFNKTFLSCLREELMMENIVELKLLTTNDLNETYFVLSENQNNCSFVSSQNHSKIIPNNKMIINAQYSINEFSNAKSPSISITTMSKSKELIASVISETNKNQNETSPTIQNQNKEKLEKLLKEVNELEEIISNPTLKIEEIKNDEELINKLEKLKENNIAKIINNLNQENHIFKKCLTEIIKNEENYTHFNNQIYFHPKESINHHQSSNNSNHKIFNQNCGLM